jgi:hypothetical protein
VEFIAKRHPNDSRQRFAPKPEGPRALLPRTRNLKPSPSWTPASLIAVALILVALIAASWAWFQTGRASQLDGQIELQTALTDAYELRALACMDLVQVNLDNLQLHALSEKRLNISNGISLCLFKHREAMRLDVRGMTSCIAEIEAVNQMTGQREGEVPYSRPAC